MTSKIEIPDTAVEMGREEYYKAMRAGADTGSAMRAALSAALPFCKQTDSEARLHLFDGRFTHPLVVQSFPGVSFIHPAEAESAPVAVITCDDHHTVAAGIVDAIRYSSDAKSKGSHIRPDMTWTEVAGIIFGDQEPDTLGVIGAALAEIAARLPCRIRVDVAYADNTPPEAVPGPQEAPVVHGWIIPRWRDYALFLSAANFSQKEAEAFAAHQKGGGEIYAVAKVQHIDPDFDGVSPAKPEAPTLLHRKEELDALIELISSRIAAYGSEPVGPPIEPVGWIPAECVNFLRDGDCILPAPPA